MVEFDVAKVPACVGVLITITGGDASAWHVSAVAIPW